jgi:hypothetical protein
MVRVVNRPSRVVGDNAGHEGVGMTIGDGSMGGDGTAIFAAISAAPAKSLAFQTLALSGLLLLSRP